MRLKDWLINEFLVWFDDTKAWVWFSSTITAHLNFRLMSYPSFPMEDYEEKVLPILEEDRKIFPYAIHCFTLSDTKSFAARFIRFFTTSNYTHAGIFVPGTRRVRHMKGKGIIEQHVLSVMKETDNFTVIRYNLPTKEAYDEAVRRLDFAFDQKAQYDYQQELEGVGVNSFFKNIFDKIFKRKDIKPKGLKLYCSELIWFVLKDIHPGITPSMEVGRKAFSPDRAIECADSVLYKREI